MSARRGRPALPESAEEDLVGLLGLAARAGAVSTGTDGVRRDVRDGRVAGVILAADGSPTQHRKLIPLLEARGIPYRILLSRERLGAATGNAPVSALGLTNRGFALRAAELADAIPSPQE
ncbi:MAG TPA: L7Ae/L30e/S12e/Gadd45 family ribosomal protein [Longimicrobiaceae bacterium]|nr:L7Ae/L30e/S12e/Gadd45 family ribosomal protein [Longimicrobiaceae bacterium]